MTFRSSVRTAALVGTLAISSAIALSGCASNSYASAETPFAQVCESKTTHVRVADKNCETKTDDSAAVIAPYVWYYFAVGRSVPSIGGTLTGGSTRLGNDDEGVPDAPAAGGKVSSSGLTGSAAEEDDDNGDDTSAGNGHSSAGDDDQGGDSDDDSSSSGDDSVGGFSDGGDE